MLCRWSKMITNPVILIHVCQLEVMLKLVVKQAQMFCNHIGCVLLVCLNVSSEPCCIFSLHSWSFNLNPSSLSVHGSTFSLLLLLCSKTNRRRIKDFVTAHQCAAAHPMWSTVVGHKLASLLEPLSVHCSVAWLSLFHRYYQGRCSVGLSLPVRP